MTIAGSADAAGAQGTLGSLRVGGRTNEIFAQSLRELARQCAGRRIAVLRAGCLAQQHELGLDELRAEGYEVSVTTVDSDNGLTRNAIGAGTDPVLLGDLRTVTLQPRSFDVVHSALLIDHLTNVEVVLDRLAAALRPGGLMLLRTFDRDSAAGLLDRIAPRPIRRALWTRYHPGAPGPFRAVYEPVVSGPGIAGYALMRGLVVAHRSAVRTRPGAPDWLSRVAEAARAAIAWLSGQRHTDAHDQLLFVLRKPEDRFARVLLARRRSAYLSGLHMVVRKDRQVNVASAGQGPTATALTRRPE